MQLATVISVCQGFSPLGLNKRRRTVVHTDLDHLAGTWSEKDFAEFQKKIADFEIVDEKMWK